MRAKLKEVCVSDLRGGDVVKWQEELHVVTEVVSLGHRTLLKLHRCAKESLRPAEDGWPFKTRPLASSTTVLRYEGGR